MSLSGGHWEVVGGADKGGIIVREDRDTKSRQLPERLATGAVVEELDLFGERLHYRLLRGDGPKKGWVSLRFQGKDLLVRVERKPEPTSPKASAPASQVPNEVAAATASDDQPVMVCWYSGGFTPKDGTALLAPLVEAVKASGLRGVLTLHFPDGYGLEGQGREPWSGYVDRLIEEIDREPSRRHRKLLLFGHSRGASPAMSVATRLGERVLKVYIVACGSWGLGQPTPWEGLCRSFQQGTDRDLLKWFSSLQPGNLILKRTAYDLPDDEFKETVANSKWFGDMLNIMRKQYRDAMYPDPDRDIAVVPAKILAVSPLLDADSQPEKLEGWKLMTSGGFELATVNAGHMDCLQPAGNPKKGEKRHCELFDLLCKDVATYL